MSFFSNPVETFRRTYEKEKFRNRILPLIDMDKNNPEYQFALRSMLDEAIDLGITEKRTITADNEIDKTEIEEINIPEYGIRFRRSWELRFSEGTKEGPSHTQEPKYEREKVYNDKVMQES